MTETAVQPAAAVDQWLASFDEALTAGDTAAAAACFLDDSYWRDLVAFTWNIRTVEGPDGRRGHARPRARAREAAHVARHRAAGRDRGRDGGVAQRSRPRSGAARATCGSRTARRGRC